MQDQANPSFAEIARLIFGNNAAYMVIGHTNHQPNWWRNEWFPYPDHLDQAVARAQKLSDDGYSVYWAPVLFATGTKREKANVVELVNVVHLDADECDPRLFLVEPSILWESSPGKFQALWLLEDAAQKWLAEDVNRRIAYYHRDSGADTAHDVGHFLRVPGTVNHKPEYDKPTVRIVHVKHSLFRLNDFAVYPTIATHNVGSGSTELPPIEPITGQLPPWVSGIIAEDWSNDMSGEAWRIVRRGMELGYPYGLIRSYIRVSGLFSQKYEGRIEDEEERLFKNARNGTKTAGPHDHPDQDCWDANCPSKPSDVEDKWCYKYAGLKFKSTSDEEQFWTSRPELEHIRTFARSRLAGPWATLGVVLARVVAYTDPSLVLPPTVGTDCSLNPFFGLVGKSSDGKGIAFGVSKDAFIWPEEKLDVIKPGSGEGLASSYMEWPRGDKTPNQYRTTALFNIPEIDALNAVTQRSGATLMPELRSAYMGEQLGFGYANQTKRLLVPEHAYRLCLVAGIQPARASVLLNDADGGTPQRFVWLPTTDGDAPDDEPEEPQPLEWKCPFTPSTTDVLMNGEVIGTFGVQRTRVEVCQTATNTIRQARKDRNKGNGNALDGHALLTRLKVAVSLSLLNGRFDVTDEDWALAGFVMQKSDETRSFVIGELASKAKTEHEKRGEADATREAAKHESLDKTKIRSVAAKLQKKLTNEWQSGSKLRKSLSPNDREYFDAAMEALKDAGTAEIEEIEYQGQAGIRARLQG